LSNQEAIKPREEKEQEEKNQVEELRGTPLMVGTLEEIIDDNHAIVSQSGGGPESYVTIMVGSILLFLIFDFAFLGVPFPCPCYVWSFPLAVLPVFRSVFPSASMVGVVYVRFADGRFGE